MERSTRHDGSNDDESTDLRDRHIPLGIDSDGRTHHYLAHTETIYVVDGSEVAHREDVTERQTDDWMAFVAERAGWRQRRYGVLFERLADAFGGQPEEAV